MTAPVMVWQRGDGGCIPDIPCPVPPAACRAESPEDETGCYECDLFVGHDGPHAAFTWPASYGRLLAVWTGEA